MYPLLLLTQGVYYIHQKYFKKIARTGCYFLDLLGTLQFSNTKQIQEITARPCYFFVRDYNVKNVWSRPPVVIYLKIAHLHNHHTHCYWQYILQTANNLIGPTLNWFFSFVQLKILYNNVVRRFFFCCFLILEIHPL